VRRTTVADHAATVVVFLGQSMPVCWIGIMLMLLFAVQWRLLPVSGWAAWSSTVLPSVTLGAFTTPLSSNAALPIVTVIGLQFGLFLGGAVLTETVFAVPGVGRLLVRAIVQLDFPIVQAGVFLLAMIIVSVNFLVDALYVYLNPTIRLR
jgi:peptide/nickel transport system permease protein